LLYNYGSGENCSGQLLTFLHYFSANLSEKLYSKFYQNRSGLVEDTTQTILRFFSVYCVYKVSK